MFKLLCGIYCGQCVDTFFSIKVVFSSQFLYKYGQNIGHVCFKSKFVDHNISEYESFYNIILSPIKYTIPFV